MRWVHDRAPQRSVRLAYCMNVHAAEDLESIRQGIREVTLPLRDRLARGRPFGVGMYLAGELARALADESGACELEQLADFLHGAQLDPFTFNAFPYAGFHASGLKRDVYRPTWMEPERLAFTRAVARCAAVLARPTDEVPMTRRHVSISTHGGAFGTWIERADDLAQCARNMASVARDLARIEQGGGPRLVLSVEAEPRSSANDSRELFGFLAFARAEAARLFADGGLDPALARELPARHLGTCLDCCHSAVEFEDPERALALATAGGPLGKLQFSSALAVDDPAGRPEACQRLLAMNEPRYLHQVTGLLAGAHTPGRPGRPGPLGPLGQSGLPDSGVSARHRLLTVDDLPDLAHALAHAPPAPPPPAGPLAEVHSAAPPGADWRACSSWRCHFHVPVDLAQLDAGLATTRDHADRLLDLCLADPSTWTTDELHIEIETYTWDVLEGPARGSGDLVDGLEREYHHVIARLESAGWKRPPEP